MKVILILMLASLPVQAQRVTNPYRDDPRAARAGAKLYRRECAGCHRKTRLGARAAPSLLPFQGQPAQEDALFRVLRNGRLRKGMPSFAHLPPQQRWQIITFLTAPEGLSQH